MKTIYKHYGLVAAALMLCLVCAHSSLADGQRQHGAHVHGIAHLNLALAGNELFVEFESPAADIVGFEHEPRNDEEKGAMQKALGVLRVGERMFKFSPDAGVKLEKVVVKTLLHHDCDHEDHNHAQGEQVTHSDVLLEYRFHCDNADKLKSVNVTLFKRFKTLQKIRVQALTPAKQTAFELTPENPVLHL